MYACNYLIQDTVGTNLLEDKNLFPYISLHLLVCEDIFAFSRGKTLELGDDANNGRLSRM